MKSYVRHKRKIVFDLCWNNLVMEDLSEENLKFLSDSHLEEINDELIVPNTSKNNHPFKCVLCPLKFSNMEGAKTHFQYDHEKQNVL